MTKRVIFGFVTEKKEEEPKPVTTEAGKTYTRKVPTTLQPPRRPPGASTVPITIQPTLQGMYQLPA